MTTTLDFYSWAMAHKAGYFTRTAWRRKHRRGIRRGSVPTAITISSTGNEYDTYTLDQTSRMSDRVWSRGYLLDLFVGFPDRFKITTQDQRIWEIHDSQIFHGSPRQSIERGFDYESCARGIRVAHARAETFHIYAEDTTRFFVIDLDNHTPTKQSCSAHLQLLERIEHTLPEFLKQIRAKTYFFQYRQQPTGIQIWVVLNRRAGTASLHQRVRGYLSQLGQDLDERLRACDLPDLKHIEILPTPTHTVSMAGAYGKEIFTNRILKPTNGRCDVVGLARYLEKGTQPKSVLKRYSSLLEATCDLAAQSKPAVPVRNCRVIPTKGYVDELFQTAIAGVQQPDVLFSEYLAPLGQFLYFRDFRADPCKIQKTIDVLYSWILAKHNGFVSRISKGQPLLVKRQIEEMVCRFESTTGSALRDWHDRIQLMDGRYSHHYVSLVDCMRAAQGTDWSLFLINCKRQQKAQNSNRHKDLPKAIQDILKTTTFATSKTRNRLIRFATKFLPLLYPNETSVSEKQINTLLGVKSRQAALQYKKELQRLGLILGNWDWRIIRGKKCSVYRLTELAWEEFHAQDGII